MDFNLRITFPVVILIFNVLDFKKWNYQFALKNNYKISTFQSQKGAKI